MSYEFVKHLENDDLTLSSVVYLWKHLPTNTYYISGDGPRVIPPPEVNDRYMLLRDDNKPSKVSKYRDTLSSAQPLTTLDLLAKHAYYGGRGVRF